MRQRSKSRKTQSNEKTAFSIRNSIKEEVKKAEGVTLDKLLPYTDDFVTEDLNKKLVRINDDYAAYVMEMKSNFVGKLRRRLGKSASTREARKMKYRCNNFLEDFKSSTTTRIEHKFLSMLAFCDDLATVIGLKNAHASEDTWVIDVGKNIDDSSRGGCPAITDILALLSEFGLTSSVLFQWWRSNHLDTQNNETYVWNDMRAMARKMIYVLDRASKEDVKRLPDSEWFYACVADAHEITVSIIKFIDAIPSSYEVMRPVAQLFIPMLFILSEILEGPQEHWKHKIAKISPNLFRLREFTEHIWDLHAPPSQDEESSANFDQGSSGEAAKSATTSTSSQKSSHDRIYSVQDLKRLQLPKLTLISVSGKLGDGAKAIVKRCRARDRPKEYAVKIYRVDDKASSVQDHWNRIIREAEFWVNVNHININKLVGYCTFDGSPYPGLVMELCEDNLIDFLPGKAFKIADRLTLVLDVASGLQYLHENDRTHGDLRPENVLVRKARIPDRYIAVLSDFGCADGLNRCRISERTDTQRAPEAYRAPEFYAETRKSKRKTDKREVERKERGMVSKEADIYAFGCVFVEIVHSLILYGNSRDVLPVLKAEGVMPVLLESIPDAAHRVFCKNTWSVVPGDRPSAAKARSDVEGFMLTSHLSDLSFA